MGAVSKSTLAERQAALVAALVAGEPSPEGFDADRLAATGRALRHKRAGEVAAVWPGLAASLGDRWGEHFSRWARGRPPQGALRDGWDMARELASVIRLAAPARVELACREAGARYSGRAAPRRRVGPVVRVVPGGLVVGVAGRVWRLGQ